MHFWFLLAIFCITPALLSLSGIFMAFITDEIFLIPAFFLVAITGSIAGYIMYRLGQSGEPENTRRNYAAIAAGWLIASLLGAIPFAYPYDLNETQFLESMRHYDLLGAWFESVSGFTSTGLTVTSDSSLLPMTIQWWRSLLQWVGGIGFVYIALFVLVPSISTNNDYNESLDTELQSDLPEELGRKGIMTIWAIYSGYTIVAGIAFWLAGMPVWESINHSMTGISTGGFNITGQSFKIYNSTIQIIAIVVMSLGAISFGVHYALWIKHRGTTLIHDANARAFIILMVMGALLIAFLNQANTTSLESVFNWVSALTNSGFSVSSLSTWVQPSVVILIIGMLIGGMTGATTGGIKIDRLRIVLRSWRFSIRDSSPVHTGSDIDQSKGLSLQYKALSLVVLYLATWVTGTLALMITTASTYKPLDLFFLAASALANVGLSPITIHALSDGALFILSLLMWAGRLEILAALALFATIWHYARSATNK